MEKLQPARIEFVAYGTPYSAAFDDVYHSALGGPTLPWHASENPPEHTATMLTINNRSKEEFEKAVVATFSKLYPNLFSTGGEE